MPSENTVKEVMDTLRPFFLRYRNTTSGYEEEYIIQQAAREVIDYVPFQLEFDEWNC